jgi:hypothetical protein
LERDKSGRNRHGAAPPTYNPTILADADDS